MAEIYALVDPRGGTIRYVGKSSGIGGVIDRFGWHFRDAARPDNNSEKARWIRELFENGLTPVVVILETCNPPGYDREFLWIRYGLSEGWPLTNVAGIAGKMSDEERLAISQRQLGRTLSTETRKRISKAIRGRTLDPDWRARIGDAIRGRAQSPEHVEKRAAAHRGKKRSAESRARISAGRAATRSRCACGFETVPGGPMKMHQRTCGETESTRLR